MKFEVFVTLKKEVLDPQGKAVENALGDIGLNTIKNIRQGKYFTVEVSETDENKASDLVKSSCEKFLNTTVLASGLLSKSTVFRTRLWKLDFLFFTPWNKREKISFLVSSSEL